MPDLDLTIDGDTVRFFSLLQEGRPVVLNLAAPGTFDDARRGDVRVVDARYAGTLTLPLLGAVDVPAAVLIRPDGYVAWVGQGTHEGLQEALHAWFGVAVISSPR